jgi:hypothetical protein
MSHFAPEPPLPEPPPTERQWWRRSVPLWSLILAVLLSLGIGLVVANTSKEDDKAAVSSSSNGATTTTAAPTIVAPTPTTTTPPAPVVVLDVSGAQTTISDNFTVTGQWVITAETNSAAGADIVILDAATGTRVDAFAVKLPGGESPQQVSGAYYLEVTPHGGRFHVVVTDVPG